MKIQWVFILCLMAGALSGCTQTLVSRVTAFSEIASERGTIAVVAADDVDAESLEFAHYSALLVEKLARSGFAIESPERADYSAALSYSVEEVSPDDPSFKSVYWMRNGYGFSPMVSDVMLVETKKGRRQYKRQLAIKISSMATKQRVYEVVADSIGSCEVMSAVFDEILTAIFTGFPQGNGKVDIVRVPGDVRC